MLPLHHRTESLEVELSAAMADMCASHDTIMEALELDTDGTALDALYDDWIGTANHLINRVTRRMAQERSYIIEAVNERERRKAALAALQADMRARFEAAE